MSLRRLEAYTYRDFILVVMGSSRALVHTPDPTNCERAGQLLTVSPLPSLEAAMQWVDEYLKSSAPKCYAEPILS
jgi:hypothetical protein